MCTTAEQLAADLARYRWGQCVHCDVALLRSEQWDLGYCCYNCDNHFRQLVAHQYRTNPRIFIWDIVSTHTEH